MYAAAQENPNGRRSVALLTTLAVHAALVAFFILWKIITPVPPFPDSNGGGSGLELSLGADAFGMGENFVDPTPTPPANKAAAAPSTPSDSGPQETLTSDVDDAPVSAPPVPKPTTKPKPNTKPADKPVTKPAEPTQEQKQQTFRDRLSGAWNTDSKGGGGKGNDNTPGVAGGNEGTLEGRGQGNGSGYYKGDGWTVDLANRTMRKKPVINDKPSVGGKVVMDIWVDANGKVLRTSQNTSLSTTVNQTLVAIARRAVLESTFYQDPKATGEQKGTMTFVFTLQ